MEQGKGKPEGIDTVAETETKADAAYRREEKFGFDPQKDLNLPASYEEVVARFGKLQTQRDQDVLN